MFRLNKKTALTRLAIFHLYTDLIHLHPALTFQGRIDPLTQ